jgi:hypothetical protein
MITPCPRSESHHTYMIPIALTTEFVLEAGGGRWAVTGADPAGIARVMLE